MTCRVQSKDFPWVTLNTELDWDGRPNLVLCYLDNKSVFIFLKY